MLFFLFSSLLAERGNVQARGRVLHCNVPAQGFPTLVYRRGMDEMEFTEAESNMNDLVSEYQQ